MNKNIPYLSLAAVTAQHENEIQQALREAVSSGWYLQGKCVSSFEQHFATYCHRVHCVGVANGLDALTLTLRAYKEMGILTDGDEILVPANTFLATVLAITENQLTPVFIEPRIDTLEIDDSLIESFITPRTRALMLVHLYGRNAYTDKIGDICKRYNLKLIEDSAQAHGIPQHGDASCFSFYPGKNLGALGDAGAVVSNDAEFISILRSLANYGFERKYVATYTGRNSRLDELQAAALSVKLRYLDEDNARRQQLSHIYYKGITNPDIILPEQLPDRDNVYHIFPILTHRRDELQQHLCERGIGTIIHYPIPPHKQQCYHQWNSLSLPITERIADEELSLPLNQTMSEEEAMYVVDAINAF